VQAVQISEGLFRQPFGLAMLRVESAGYGARAADAGVSTTLFPLIPAGEAPKLLDEILPEFAVFPSLSPPPKRALRRYILRSVLPFVVLAGLALPTLTLMGLMETFSSYYIIGAVSALTLAALYGWAAFRAAGWAVEGDCFVSRSRSLARTTSIAPRRRLQSRSVVRNPLQRRLDLATFRARVASGGGGATFEVVDIESDSAEALIPALGPKPRTALE
ncbi:MAG: PH domain-containing protein, partial [Rubrobacter sp.]